MASSRIFAEPVAWCTLVSKTDIEWSHSALCTYLNNNIEPVRVVLFDLLELRCGVAPGELDVDVGGT